MKLVIGVLLFIGGLFLFNYGLKVNEVNYTLFAVAIVLVGIATIAGK